MNKILTILSLLFCLTAYSQKLTVESFEENTADLSARTNPRQDNNRNPCALLKVQLASPGAVFEGNVMGDVEYKTSEYWVYMTKGSNRLTIKLEGYLPLPVKFEPLNGNTTYLLTVSGVVKTDAPQQEVRKKTGWIILDSDPEDAAVYIDNKYVGNTPLDSYKQTYGTYNYRIEKPNYHSSSGNINLNSAKIEKLIKLTPAFGSISVKCSIAGATVLLDGRNIGKTTPCVLSEVPSGSHTVSLQKEGYAPIHYNVVVEDGVEAHVNGTLDARFAAITIKTIDGAEILVDNEKKGSTTCTLDLMEGYHDITVRLAHYKDVEKQIHVEAGHAQTVTLAPTPKYGSLDIITIPRQANITIDGKQYGQTPFTVEEILEGEHTVVLSLDGFAIETKRVVVKHNQTETVNVTLSNHKCVDLGLSVKWATCNVGASKPEDYGDYYAWGETVTKRKYDWSTYLDSPNRDGKSFRKYAWGKNTKLDSEDDVAHVKWGGSWRMPTRAEQDELRNKCSWKWTSQGGVNGYVVTGPNGNSIFLPAAGFRYGSDLLSAGSAGNFWSSSLYESYSNIAYYLGFNSSNVGWCDFNRYYGQSVRAVCP